MKCPKCQQSLPDSARRCSSCGADLSLLQNVKELSQELKATEAMASQLARRMGWLNERLESVQESMVEAIRPPAPAMEAEPPAPEVVPAVDAVPAAAEREKEMPPPITRAPRIPRPQPTASTDEPEFELKLGQKGLLIVGIVVMVLGIGYFLKYSFEQGWVQPWVRVLMTYVAGLGLLGLGEFFRRRELPFFGLNLIGGGIATLYFASFAGFHIYHLIPQYPAFGVMIVVTALACVLSLVYDTRWLAVLGLIGGFLTPVVLSTGSNQQVALMLYMTILNVGILVLAFHKHWRLLTWLGFFATWVLFTSWYARWYHVEAFWTTTIFLNVFFFIYLLAPFVYYVTRDPTARLGGFSIGIMNTFIAFGFSYGMIEEAYSSEAVSIVTLAYTAIFLGMGSWLLRNRPEAKVPLIVALSKAMLFLGITVPLLFDGAWVTVFWALQAVGLFWASERLDHGTLRRGAYLLLGLAIFRLCFFEYLGDFRFDGTFRPSYTARLEGRWLTSAIVLGVVAWFARQRREAPKVATFLWTLFGVLLFGLLNMEVWAFLGEYMSRARHAGLSVLWTLFSLVLMLLGFARRLRPVRTVAMALFLGTLVKVFMIDMSQASTPFRIVSFIVLGAVLIGASYLYHRYKSLILPDEAEEVLP